MGFVISIPKGKNILEFLQELDGGQGLAKDAWHFMRRDVVEELISRRQRTNTCNFSRKWGLLFCTSLRFSSTACWRNRSTFRAMLWRQSPCTLVHCNQSLSLWEFTYPNCLSAPLCSSQQSNFSGIRKGIAERVAVTGNPFPLQPLYYLILLPFYL